MEKEAVTRSEEVACIALYPNRWAGTVTLATTVAQTNEIEGELEAEESQEGYILGATEAMSVGPRMAGPLLIEEAYATDLLESVQYYWSFTRHQGLVCVVDYELRQKIPEDLVSYAEEDTTPGRFIIQPGNRMIYTAVSPTEPFLSEELSDFSNRYNISAHLRTAIEILKASFPSVERVNLQLEQDPESGDEWILINFDVSGRVDDILLRYDHYTDLLVKSVPWPERDRIRIAYNIM